MGSVMFRQSSSTNMVEFSDTSSSTITETNTTVKTKLSSLAVGVQHLQEVIQAGLNRSSPIYEIENLRGYPGVIRRKRAQYQNVSEISESVNGKHHPDPCTAYSYTMKTTSAIRAIWAATLLLLLCPSSAVNLTKPWAESPNLNMNKAYHCLKASMEKESITAYAIVQNGELVAEDYDYDEGASSATKYHLYSVTKSWASMMIGRLFFLGLLDEDTTLGEIFNEPLDWVNVTQATEKQALTIRAILSFSSGLEEKGLSVLGFSAANELLNSVDYIEEAVGNWNYLGTFHILSWIIYRITDQTPLEFARSEGIFSRLGIDESEIKWKNSGPVEMSAYGLYMNVRQMAKLGQLYLQRGDPEDGGGNIVSADWVSKSTMNQLPNGYGYGYQWYLAEAGLSTDGYYAAGKFGQRIFVNPSRNTVVAILRLQIGAAQRDRHFGQFLIDMVDSGHLDELDIIQDSCGESGLLVDDSSRASMRSSTTNRVLTWIASLWLL